MTRKLTASDRKSLIRLASSLPKGSPKRRAILAGLQKTSASVWAGRDSDRVVVELDTRRESIWKGKATVAEAKKMDQYLSALHQMAEENDLARLSDIDDEIKYLLEEKNQIGKKYGPAIAWAKKMKIWKHFEKGGDTMIPVMFLDADGDYHQLVDGVVEGV